jgi:hypothetical protein
MANLGLLGALSGVGQAMSTIGADIVKRREQALEWAQQEARDQRRALERKDEQEAGFAHETALTAYREEQATKRNDADNAAADARTTATIEGQKERDAADREYQSGEKAKDRKAERDLATLRSSLDAQNDAASARLKQQLESGDVAGVKYGEKYSQPMKNGQPYGRPVRDDKSPYSELLLVRKDGSIVHSGKLILAPQNRSGQDGEDSPY